MKKIWSKIYPKPRPYWFVDAKWICGILFLLSFTATLWLYNFTQVISKENLVDIIANDTQSLLRQKVESIDIKIQSSNDLKNQISSAKQNIQNLADQAKNNQGQFQNIPIERIQPIKGLNFYIEKNQIKNYVNQAEEAIYNEIVKLINNSKVEDLLGTAETIQKVLPQQVDIINATLTGLKQQIIDSITFPKVYSEKTYQKYQNIYTILLTISIILLLGVIFFSYRFGRIFNLGFLMLLSAGPGTYIFNNIYRLWKESPLTELTRSKIPIVKSLAEIIINNTNKQINALYYVHRNILIVASILILISIVGKIIHTFYTRKKEVRPASKKSKK
jgi:hypothetical protein